MFSLCKSKINKCSLKLAGEKLVTPSLTHHVLSSELHCPATEDIPAVFSEVISYCKRETEPLSQVVACENAFQFAC